MDSKTAEKMSRVVILLLSGGIGGLAGLMLAELLIDEYFDGDELAYEYLPDEEAIIASREKEDLATLVEKYQTVDEDDIVRTNELPDGSEHEVVGNGEKDYAGQYQSKEDLQVEPDKRDGDIKFLTEAQFSAYLNTWDKIVVEYYPEDDVVVGPNGHPFADEELVVGEFENQFGTNEDPDIVYILNEPLESLVELVRMRGAYEDIILSAKGAKNKKGASHVPAEDLEEDDGGL